MMQPASRAALAAARERLESRISTASAVERERLGDDLSAVAAVLVRQPVIRRHLADAAAPEGARRAMLDTLFGGKIGQLGLLVLGDVVNSRWSAPRDLVGGLEELAWQSQLALADRDGVLDDIEDELFRFGRILAAQPRLGSLLGDETAPAEGRVALLNRVLAGRASPVTRRLLEHAVRMPRRRGIDEIIGTLVDRAAARRERSVAYVTAAGPLSVAQERRLVDLLDRIYQRPISLKISFDPALLGGLVIRVGDELIDGSVAARLGQARQWMSR
ncbi:MAG TPA: F0F1 ATP synthase subunit delta [Pseudonocardiaceae bacterium]|nr:F0F1 ATP synthase subunit delta [Pseudonocardiaceae bacterium]